MITFCHVMVCVLLILMVVALKMLWNLNKKVKAIMDTVKKKPEPEYEKINVDQCFTFEESINALKDVR